VTAKLMLDTSVENFDLFMLYADLAQAQTITLPAIKEGLVIPWKLRFM